MVAIAATSALLVGTVSFPAFAVNDPFVPATVCSAENSEAVGHPAIIHQQPQGAEPPFSASNPGASTGAKANAHSQAAAHCPNAAPQP